MDSVAVHQITELAKSLGIEARIAFLWWVALHFSIHALWAGVLIWTVSKATRLLSNVGDGKRLSQAVEQASGLSWPKASDYAKAVRLIIEGWRVDK